MRAHLQKAKGSGGPHGIGPNWRPAWLPKPLVYVYKSDVPCTDIRRGKDRFEDALAALFDRGFLRVDDPKDAELFYHPACLVDLFMTSRITGKANAFGRSALLYHAEQRIVRQIKALGYEDRPHIVNALRCYGVREERNPANKEVAGLRPKRATTPRRTRCRRCGRSFPAASRGSMACG